jgi:hypothetical protein
MSIPKEEKFIFITGKEDLFVFKKYTDRVLMEKNFTVLNHHALECGHFELVLPDTPCGKEVLSIITSHK